MCTALESDSADEEVDEDEVEDEVEELAPLSSSGTMPSVRLESRSLRDWEDCLLVAPEDEVLSALEVEDRDGALVMVMLVNSRFTCRGK